MISCPVCTELVSEESPAPIRDIVICSNCLSSIVASTGLRATSADTLILAPEELKALKNRRASLREAKASV